MAFWNVDLTTQDGALGAAQNGSMACFIAAGLTVLGMGVQTMMSAPTSALGPILVTLGLESLIFIAAGFRLRSGKGMILGGIGALMLILELVAKLASLSGIGGAVINAVLLIVIINGVRGARVLRSDALGHDEVGQIFE